MYNTKSEWKGKLWTWGDYNIPYPPNPRSAPEWQGWGRGAELDNGGGFVWGQRYTGNLYLPLKFAVNFKLL